MRRHDLAHILRAACRIAGDSDVVVIGSQAILGIFEDDELPNVVKLSREADIAFLDDPDRAKADAVDGAIGEMSSFHHVNRVYAEGVHIDVAELARRTVGRSRRIGRQGRNSPEQLREGDVLAACVRAADVTSGGPTTVR